MIIGPFDFRFVIDFIVVGPKIILIKRTKEPWMNHWNGVGGHIENGETAFEAVNREVTEEVGIDLQKTTRTTFAGIMTWETGVIEKYIPGMFMFVSVVLPNTRILTEERYTPEGVVTWKSLSWACSKSNKDVADNIPYFLPIIVSGVPPQRYHCVFVDGILKKVTSIELPKEADPDFRLPS